ncbi:MAG: family 16 glycoside hydrolase [Verrucomicrobiota bacterium]
MKTTSSFASAATVLAGAWLGTLTLLTPGTGLAEPDPSWKVHDWSRPRPPVIEPGTASTPDQPGKPPSDATVLFEGQDLSQWCSLDGSPPQWIVKDGCMECVKDVGYIRTLQNFGDCQLHIEWAAPVPARGESQGRGNSGVFLMGRYEVQVLDCYQNMTYADGQASAVYGQYPPLVNAARPPGQWQSYDIIFTRPHFDDKGALLSAARLTVLHNGVLVQNNVALTGPTGWMKREPYQAHSDKLPLSLQDHGNPVRYRNIWIRELTDAAQKEFTFARDLLDRYVGTFQVDERMSIVVSRQDNQLTMRLVHPNREHAYPLFAASKTKFFAKSVDSQVIFQTNAQGAAEALTFHIAGENRPARKIK